MNKYTIITNTAILALTLMGSVYWLTQSKTTAPQHTIDNETKLEATTNQVTTGIKNSNLEYKKVVAKNCKNHYLPNENLTQWRQMTQNIIKSHIVNLENKGISRLVLEMLAIKSGVGLFEGRKVLKHFNGDYRKPPYTEHKAFLADFKQKLQIDNLLENNDIKALADKISNNKIALDDYYPTKQGMVFLLGYILHSQNENQAATIDILIDSGVKIFYADLVAVTQLNIPREVLDKTYRASNLAADKVLKYKGRYTSLVQIAIAAQNATAAQFWLEMGSPTKPDLLFNNAMDTLANHGVEIEPEARNTLFEQLAKQGLTSYWPANIDKLAKLISPQLLTKYELNKSSRPKLPQAQIQQLNTLIKQLHTKVLTGIVDFDTSNAKEHPCFNQLGKRSTKFAINYRPQIMKKPSRKEKNDARAKRIANAQAMFNDNEAIEAHLGKGQSRESKQDIQHYRRLQLKEQLAKHDAQFPIPKLPQQEQQLINQAIDLANKGQWKQAHETLNRLEATDEELMTTLLAIAFYAQTDFEIMAELLEKGGQLPPSAIHFLITKNNVKLAQQLLPYNLDIHLKIAGDSTLVTSIKKDSLDILKFLLKSGVQIDSDNQGYDALDHALKQFNLRTLNTAYVETLMNAGAQIELSHRQQVEIIGRQDMEAYYKLINRWPKLKL